MEVSFEVNQIKKTLTTHTMDRGLSEKRDHTKPFLDLFPKYLQRSRYWCQRG